MLAVLVDLLVAPVGCPSLLGGLSVLIPMVGSVLIAKIPNSLHWSMARDQPESFHPDPLHGRRLAFEHGVNIALDHGREPGIAVALAACRLPLAACRLPLAS